MTHMVPPWPLLATFLAASLVLAITPGPGVLYIVSRSVANGRGAALASVGGVALGNLGNAVGASIGLAAVFAVSAAAFTVIRWAGAGYLVYLGMRALRAPDTGALMQGAVARCSPARLFRDGLIVALLNPKTAVFFAAFLPQFMGHSSTPMLQSFFLGALFVAIAAATDTCYALTAATMAQRLSHARRAGSLARYVTGSVLVGLGVFTALSGSRAGSK